MHFKWARNADRMLNFHNLPTDKQSYSTYPLSEEKLDGRWEKRRGERVRAEGGWGGGEASCPNR